MKIFNLPLLFRFRIQTSAFVYKTDLSRLARTTAPSELFEDIPQRAVHQEFIDLRDLLRRNGHSRADPIHDDIVHGPGVIPGKRIDRE